MISAELQQPIPTPEENSYAQTEYFFYLLPCYYALVSFSIRYYSIIKELPERDVNRLPGQFIVIAFEDIPQTVPGVEKEPPPASYVIKSKLSLLNSYIYLLMFIVSLIGTSEIFYGSKHKKLSSLYLVGFIAWSFGAVLLRREYRRKISQSLWTHRFFWVFSGTFAITKMFEDYLLPMNFILNVISIITNIVLMVYGIYRAEDNQTLEIIHSEEMPRFVINFFQFLELNPLLRKIFMIEQKKNRLLEQELEYIENLSKQDILALQKNFKAGAQATRNQVELLNKLPRRNIYIDKKIEYQKKPNGKLAHIYKIVTQIGNSNFESAHTISEFQSVFQQLQLTFNESNFPRLALPKLKLSAEPSFRVNQAENLQNWLSEIFKKPIFMIKPLLKFLNIDSQNSAPFISYFDFSYKSFCSKHYALEQLNKSIDRSSRKSLVGYFQEERETTMGMNSLIKQKLTFEVQVDSEITDPNEFGFCLTCIREDPSKQKIKWKILKSQQNIQKLNPRIQSECNISVSAFYSLIPNLGGQKHSKKAEIYKNYLSQLLKNEKYFCQSLFQFIRFDPIEVQVKILGGRIEIASRKVLNRDESHYFETYSETQNNIQVLRVDKQEDGTFSFKIKRMGFQINKTQKQLYSFKQVLDENYQNISYVPRLDLSGCSKGTAKQRVETFLSGIQTLPNIELDPSYKKFYGILFLGAQPFRQYM